MPRKLTLGLALGAVVAFGASAQDLPKTQFKVVGLNSPTVASSVDELPFWRETVTMTGSPFALLEKYTAVR